MFYLSCNDNSYSKGSRLVVYFFLGLNIMFRTIIARMSWIIVLRVMVLSGFFVLFFLFGGLCFFGVFLGSVGLFVVVCVFLGLLCGFLVVLGSLLLL